MSLFCPFLCVFFSRNDCRGLVPIVSGPNLDIPFQKKKYISKLSLIVYSFFCCFNFNDVFVNCLPACIQRDLLVAPFLGENSKKRT